MKEDFICIIDIFVAISLLLHKLQVLKKKDHYKRIRSLDPGVLRRCAGVGSIIIQDHVGITGPVSPFLHEGMGTRLEDP